MNMDNQAPKPVKERDNLDLFELILQLHSMAINYPSKEMHDAYMEARNEMELRIALSPLHIGEYRTFEEILEGDYHVQLEDNRRDESIKLATEKYASQSCSQREATELLKKLVKAVKDNYCTDLQIQLAENFLNKLPTPPSSIG